jgi:hypothetical protein
MVPSTANEIIHRFFLNIMLKYVFGPQKKAELRYDKAPMNGAVNARVHFVHNPLSH